MAVTHKIISAENGGGYYLFEAVFEAGDSAPLHIHHNEDEILYILEGMDEIQVGDQQLRAEEGAVVHLPRGIPHAHFNPLDIPLKALTLMIPGGLEGYFEELESALQQGVVDDETVNRISLKYGIEWLE